MAPSESTGLERDDSHHVDQDREDGEDRDHEATGQQDPSDIAGDVGVLVGGANRERSVDIAGEDVRLGRVATGSTSNRLGDGGSFSGRDLGFELSRSLDFGLGQA